MAVNVDEQIKAVRRVVSTYSDDDIVLVLQHHDYDVSKAISDFVEGRVTNILKEWTYSRKQKNKTKKNKKRKQAEASSSKLANGDVRDKPNVNGDNVPIAKEESSLLPEPSSSDVTLSDNTVKDPQVAAVALKHMLTNGLGPAHSSNLLENHVPPISDPPSTDEPPKPSNQATSNTVEKAFRPHVHNVGRRSRTSSESSTKAKNRKKHKTPSNLTLSNNHDSNVQSNQVQASFHSISMQNKKSIEKAARDLQRCSVSFGRYKALLNDEINDSYKRIKQSFEEVTNALVDREVTLIRKLDDMKAQAFDLLAKREARAAELKKQTDRVATMNQHQLSELRSDIKHFVAERKYDEELGRTTRFVYDRDVLIKIIATFGEISAVKNSYSTKPRERLESTASDVSSHSIPSTPQNRPIESPAPPADTTLPTPTAVSHPNPPPTDSDRNPPAAPVSHPTPPLAVSSSTPPAAVAPPVEKSHAADAKASETNHDDNADWADAVESHPLPESRASWASDTPLVSPNPLDEKKMDEKRHHEDHQQKPQRQRQNRNNQRDRRNYSSSNSVDKDKTMMPPPDRIPTPRSNLGPRTPQVGNSGRQNEDRDDRADGPRSGYRNNNRDHNSGAGDGNRNAPRGRRGGFRGGYRGIPRGGFRNGPYRDDHYAKTHVNGDVQNPNPGKQNPDVPASPRMNNARNRQQDGKFPSNQNQPRKDFNRPTYNDPNPGKQRPDAPPSPRMNRARNHQEDGKFHPNQNQPRKDFNNRPRYSSNRQVNNTDRSTHNSQDLRKNEAKKPSPDKAPKGKADGNISKVA